MESKSTGIVLPKRGLGRDGKVAMTVDPLDSTGLLKELNGEEWQGLPAETIMGHIHLHVHDLDQARHFYCDGLGFEITSDQLNQALFLSSNGYHHHLGLNTWQGTDAPPASDHKCRAEAIYLTVS